MTEAEWLVILKNAGFDPRSAKFVYSRLRFHPDEFWVVRLEVSIGEAIFLQHELDHVNALVRCIHQAYCMGRGIRMPEE